MLLLPDGVKIGAADAVTISAPIAWATVNNDLAGAMADQPVEVCTDRSFVGTVATKTLKVGLNIGHQQNIYYGTYSLTRNLRYRMAYWFNGGVAASDANGWPTTLTQDSVIAPMIADQTPNGVDATRTPTPEGLYAVGWGVSGGSTAACSLVGFGDSDVAERHGPGQPGRDRRPRARQGIQLQA